MSAMPAESSAAESSAAAPGPARVRLVPVPRPAATAAGGSTAVSVPAGPASGSPAADPVTWAPGDDEPKPSPDLALLPDPRRWTALLAQAVVEILGGRRPVAQVVRWVDPEIAQRLRRSAAPPGRAPGAAPVRVRRVRVSTSMEGTVEAVAVVDDGARCRALAFRLEALHRRWLCTSLDLI